MKLNGNTLTLSNTGNNYTGQTLIYGGSVTTNTNPQGNILVSAIGNALTFSQDPGAVTVPYSGSITGIGGVTVTATSRRRHDQLWRERCERRACLRSE